MLSQVTTKSFNVYLNNGVIVSAKCRSTGRFVKRAMAQVELKVELKQRANLKNRLTVLQAHNIKQAARMKDRLNMQAKNNVKTAINSSLVEKTKVQLQASIAKVAMLGVVTLSAFNIAQGEIYHVTSREIGNCIK